MRRARLLAVACIAACAPAPDAGAAPRAAQAADSIVLERGVCFGFCPAYRVRVDAQGRVHFQSKNTGDQQRTAEDTIAPAQFKALLAEADRIGFARLPGEIQSDSTYGPVAATDHSTVIVELHTGAQLKRVRDYLGCRLDLRGQPGGPLVGLRQFESLIDSIAGSKQWARPANVR